MKSVVSSPVQGASWGSDRLLESIAGYLWRVPVCAVVYVVGTMAAGAVGVALGMKMPGLPEGVDQQQMGPSMLGAAMVLTLALAPLARRQSGGYAARWLVLAAFTYVSLGINTAIEASIFTQLGGMSSMAWLFLPPTVLCAAAVVLLFGSSRDAQPFRVSLSRFFAARRSAHWMWRLALALVAFPVIYWLFGSLLIAVLPWALDFYREGRAGLTLPDPLLIVAVVLLRSLLFLVSVLPLLVTWTGSRRSLVLALGWAYGVLVGLFGLMQATWMPAALRVGHSVEILADSFVYAWVLVVLLVPAGGNRKGAHALRTNLQKGDS